LEVEMMKVKKPLLLLLLLVLPLILAQSANARPPQQSISLQVEVTPNADGTYHIRGSVVVTGLHPEGQEIVTNEVDVHVEFMAGAGSWPVFYEWWSHADTCYTIGVERCATEEEFSGLNVSASSIFAQTLSDSDDGKPFSFEADVQPPEGADQMRVVVRFEHTYTCGACYWDARQYLWDVYGPIDVTAITPPPTTEPTVVEATAVLPPTPGPTPTVILCDLSIQDGVVVLQAVAGGNLVGGRDVAVLVRAHWAEYHPERLPSGLQIKVSVDVDGNQVPPKTGGIGEAFEFILPASLFPAGVTTEHHILVEAEVVGEPCVDPYPDSNRFDETFTSYASRPMRLLFVRIRPHKAPAISASRLDQFAREAVPYLRQVYPVPRVHRVPGGYYVFGLVDSRWSVSVNVARTLSLHNSNRCRSNAPCNVPRADLAVGVFPGHYYGAEVEGWLYGRGSSTWGKWMDATAQGVGWLSGGGSRVDRAAITSATNFINTAHEIGHHFNLEDEYSSTGDLGRRIQDVIIWQDGRLLNPSNCSGEFCPEYYNFMGNAGLGYPGTQYWVDANTWNKILGEINRRGFAMMPHQLASLSWHPAQEEITEIEGPALLVMGLVDQQGEGTIHTIDRLNRYEELPTTEGEWLLETLDIAGTAMSEVHFDTYPLDIDEQVPFLVTLPVDDPTQIAQVRLSHAGSTHSTAVRSPTPPTVAFDLLPDFDGDTLTISWNTQDADGDELRSSLFYSSDGGQTWHVLGLDLPDTRLEIDPLTLPGGEAQFRAIVSDGLNESEILTPPIIVPDRPPSAYVELPWGDTFAADEPVILQGYGYDLEDGDIPSAQLQWQDETGQSLGQGAQLQLTGLSPGEHRIILLAEDSAGQTGRAEVIFAVEGEPLTGLIDPIVLLCLFGTAGMAGLAAFVLLLFFLARRRRLAPAAAPAYRQPPPVTPPARLPRPRGRPEEFVDREPPGPPESLD